MSPVRSQLSVPLRESCPLNVAAGKSLEDMAAAPGLGDRVGERDSPELLVTFRIPLDTSVCRHRRVWGDGQSAPGQEPGLWGGVPSVTVEGLGPRHQADLGLRPWGLGRLALAHGSPPGPRLGSSWLPGVGEVGAYARKWQTLPIGLLYSLLF